MSMICLVPNLAFVHIQKTAGTAIKTALRSVCDRRVEFASHDPARYCRGQMVGVWGRCLHFAFVRNPWDWWVSAFHWWDFCQRYTSFAEFLRRHAEWRGSLPWGGYGPMLDDEAGNCMVEHVLRFERLAEEFAAVCGRVAIDPPPTLPHRNRTRHCPWRQYYAGQPDLVKIVRHLSGPDIERFGYQFGG